ncbi:hypothetical protein FBU30_007099 [Linnemannia zychae]|nr:hypothetical protein FBU30_007099 [Linnemannia zychae]
MTNYTTNNFRYLRISKHKVLPLNLLLSKDDLIWFNDYSFQEILTVLKPILLSKIELFNQGHVIKRTINPIASSALTTGSEDGLEDAGIILGGEQQPEESSRKHTKRRAATGRPQFGIRFGFRTHTTSERGGTVLISNKNLGFAKIKAEEGSDVGNENAHELGNSQKSSGRRTSMGLASLEGELSAEDGTSIVVRDEDESHNLRVSDFQHDDIEKSQDSENDDDYQDESSSQRQRTTKRKQSESSTMRGKRAKAYDNSPLLSSQTDQKPTLQVTYGAMKLHPQTLYIIVRTLDSGMPSLSSILPFFSAAEPVNTADSTKEPTVAASPTTQEDEESLFPPGLDYFLDS